MKSTSIVPGGITLMAIGYEYNYRKVLGFIATEASGSTVIEYWLVMKNKSSK